jgi:hypothetical protein
MVCRFEALKYSLALASRQVRILCPVVQTPVAAMLGMWQNLSDSQWMAGELVRDHDTRHRSALAFEHLTQEPLGSLLIASALHQDVGTMPSWSTARHDQCRLPRIFSTISSRSLLSPARPRRRHSPAAKTAPNLAHHRRITFAANDDAALGEEILHVAKLRWNLKCSHTA